MSTENPIQALLDRQAALLAQCPAPLVLPKEEAAKLPIHVTRWGTAGPAVFIVHGGVQSGLGGGPASFLMQKPLAEKGWQLQLVDRPGFGTSPSRGVDDMEADGAWIADMLCDGVHLIGHSWGGGGVLLAAGHRPEAVRSLILVEPALQLLAAGDPEMEQNGDAKADHEGQMAPLFAAKTPAEFGRSRIRSLGASVEGEERQSIVAQYEKDPDLAARMACALLQAKMARLEMLRQAAQIVAQTKIPVLTISGGWSPYFDTVSKIMARLTGGRHALVRSPDHFPQLSNPAEFNVTIDIFMREAELIQAHQHDR